MRRILTDVSVDNLLGASSRHSAAQSPDEQDKHREQATDYFDQYAGEKWAAGAWMIKSVVDDLRASSGETAH